MRQLAVTRFDGDLISAAEYIAQYADAKLQDELADVFDSTEVLLFVNVSRELAKKHYK